MSETFTSGPETYPAAKPVVKNRLVTLTDKGVEHATADGDVYGAVLTDAAPKPEDKAVNTLVHTPWVAAVYSAPQTVRLACDAADGVKRGAKIYAAADGKVATTGTVVVGVAAMNGADGLVPVKLTTPAHAG
ncbi:hypothetical protein C1Y63_10555 [Corynebacterium sp. 13CS0277]|uniref:hypothetical protein n=1 Tax=Corynebacterium sp. 13CS0277 TaxID=2071994 RepID=UPI000D04111C|nr:hypothetical protein [Corynebacterium sp. 13CS0277]PRQ10626.1 hypothetical protein C1Y63_10555 [Corynebacterium sp. 13CS0277]